MTTKEMTYQEQIDYLRANPNEVYDKWVYGGNKSGSLFAFLAIDPENDKPDTGCLTMIRNGDYVSEFGPEHTDQIRSDERIPASRHIGQSNESFAKELLQPGVLEVFVEYQTDAENRRKAIKDNHENKVR